MKFLYISMFKYFSFLYFILDNSLLYIYTYIYIYIYMKIIPTYIYIYVGIIFIIQRVKALAIPCPHQPPTRGDNTVSVAQGGTATALSYRNCVITPGWRLMRAGYRTCFHTLYDIYIYISSFWGALVAKKRT